MDQIHRRNEPMKRNYALDLLKFYFAITIAVSHAPFAASFPAIASDKIVMLFFILSGYFLVSSFLSGKYESPGQYTARRLSRRRLSYIRRSLSCSSSRLVWRRKRVKCRHRLEK